MRPHVNTEGLEFLPCPFSGGAAGFPSSGWETFALFPINLPMALDPEVWLSRLSFMGGGKQDLVSIFNFLRNWNQGSGHRTKLSQLESRDGVES